jgi:hypothetical protein
MPTAPRIHRFFRNAILATCAFGVLMGGLLAYAFSGSMPVAIGIAIALAIVFSAEVALCVRWCGLPRFWADRDEFAD